MRCFSFCDNKSAAIIVFVLVTLAILFFLKFYKIKFFIILDGMDVDEITRWFEQKKERVRGTGTSTNVYTVNTTLWNLIWFRYELPGVKISLSMQKEDIFWFL